MNLVHPHKRAVAQQACNIILQGGVVLFPTDTIWGLGCDARLSASVSKICSIKQRTPEKGFVLIDYSYDALQKQHPDICTPDFMQRAEQEPYSFTFVYPDYEGCCEGVKAPDGTVAVRVVRDDFCRELIQIVGFPLVATSANIAGRPFPYTYHDIEQDIIDSVNFVVPSEMVPVIDSHHLPSPSPIYCHQKENPNQWIRLR